MDTKKIQKGDRKELKKEHLLQLSFIFVVIVALVILSSFYRFRIDLTSDKRFTLSNHTHEMIRDLDDIVYFKVYLDGELPSGFLRLKQSSRQLLEEFKAIGGDRIHFEFIDPAESPDKDTRNKVFEQLYKKGLEPTNLHVKEDDGSSSQKIIFPGIIVSYRQNEFPVNILKNYSGLDAEANLNQSVQSLEYELTFAIDNLINLNKKKIGLVSGHGEFTGLEIDDLVQSLFKTYSVYSTTLDGNLTSLRDTLGQNRFDLIIIPKPTATFSENDKFLIDQYVMHGGRVLWLLDAVNVHIDSLAYTRSTMALDYNLRLDDQLFQYGVRFNKNLLQDMQCAVIPINAALEGQQPRFVPAPWIFFPLLAPSDKHPITKNLNYIKTQFAGTIDTVGNSDKVTKTVLLTSSKYSRIVNAPILVDLSIIDKALDQKRFTISNQPVAMLVEGQFNSVFTNRIPSELAGDKDIDFREVSPLTKMVFISDGDIIRNAVKGSGKTAEALPLGYDRFTKETFGNKDFLLNVINYLCDKQGLMESRNKEVKLRLLDRPKITSQRLFWQLLNILLPLVIVISGAFIYMWNRRRIHNN